MDMTIEKTYGHILSNKQQIETTLQRCQNAPYPSTERIRKISNLRSEADLIVNRASDIIAALERPAKDAFANIQIELDSMHTHLNSINQQIQALQQENQSKTLDFQRRTALAQAQAQAQAIPPSQGIQRVDLSAITVERTRFQAEYSQKMMTLTKERDQIQSTINDFMPIYNSQREQMNSNIAFIQKQNSSAELTTALHDIEGVLDRAGNLEREIASGANNTLLNETSADFRNKTQDFSEAETFHIGKAQWNFWALTIILGVSTVLICLLFIFPDLVSRIFERFSPSDQAPTSDTILRIEKIIIIASGRVAILLFLAWIVRYLANLHRVHSEQAVIYRDRRAALGVAELLLNATPELQQKRQILEKLSDVYLDFGKSAFNEPAPKISKQKSDEEAFDKSVKQLKSIVNAVEPLAESIGKTVLKN